MKFFLLIGILVVNVGCATVSNLDKNSRLENISTEAIIVIGVSPKEYKINIVRGDLINDKFEFSTVVTPTAWVGPSQGFVVLNVPVLKKDQAYAILRVGNNDSIISKEQCEGWPAVTFNPKAGKINYITSIEYSKVGKTILLQGKIKGDSNKAKRYMRNNYKKLSYDFINLGYKLRTVIEMRCAEKFKKNNPIKYTN